MINFESVGFRIKVLRRKKNITQEKLSEILDISTEHLSRIETGSYRPSIKLLEKISETFDVDDQYLLFGTQTTTDESHNLTEKINLLTDKQKQAIEIIINSMIKSNEK